MGTNQNICFAGTTSIGGNPVASGGSGGFNYAWSPSATLNSGAIPNPDANPVVSTTYLLQVTDLAGCTREDSVSVQVNPQIFADAGADTLLCQGSQLILGGSPSGAGGSGSLTYSWTPTAGLGNPISSNPVATVTAAITYQLQVQDAQGCSQTDEVNLAILPDPQADFNFLAMQDSVNFTDLSLNADSLHWDFGDAGSSTDAQPGHSYTSPGLYNVCLIAFGACGNDTLCQSVNVVFTGLNQTSLSRPYVLFPNPNHGTFWLLPQFTGACKLLLRNQLGQIVRRVDSHFEAGVKTRLDYEGLAEAVYLLEIRVADYVWYEKIIFKQ